MKEGSIMSFSDYLEPFADRGHNPNPKCVDEVLLGLDDSSVTVGLGVVVVSFE